MPVWHRGWAPVRSILIACAHLFLLGPAAQCVVVLGHSLRPSLAEQIRKELEPDYPETAAAIVTFQWWRSYSEATESMGFI